MSRGVRLAVKILTITTAAGLALSTFLWFGYTRLKGYSSNPLTYAACMTETQAKFENIAGWDFEADDTGCDTLAKDEEVRVFAISSQAKNSRLGRLFARRRLVFAYDPGIPGVSGLTVQATDAKHIVISLPDVSTVFEKSQSVGEVAIKYDIHKIEYP